MSTPADAAQGQGALLQRSLKIDPRRFWMGATRASIIGLFIIALGTAVQIMAPLLVPVIAAVVLGTIIGPLVTAAASRRVPAAVTAGTIAAAFAAALYAATITLSGPLSEWIARAPELGTALKQKLRFLDPSLSAVKELQQSVSTLNPATSSTVSIDAGPNAIIQGVLATLTPAVTQFLLFFFSLIFYLVYREVLQRKLVLFFRDRKARLTALQIIKDIEANLTRYFGTLTMINIALGLATGIAMFGLGLPGAVLWGVLAGVLNYLPYVGTAIVTLALLLAGVMSFETLGQALMPPLAYVALNAFESEVITPNIIGRRFTLNPFVVFLSIALWTWMWGAAGAFLAVPLLIAASVVSDHLILEEDPDLP